MEYTLFEGTGRSKLNLQAVEMGNGIVVRIFNENPHLGSIAVSEFDDRSQRTSVSMITRLGHKDDILAQKAAYSITKHIHRPACVIVGVHLSNITEEEISRIISVNDTLIEKFLNLFKS
jgi:hypothetical protein